MSQLSNVSSIHRAVTKSDVCRYERFAHREIYSILNSCVIGEAQEVLTLYRRSGMPPARAIIHYLTASHVFPVHPSHPDVQRNVRVRQADGGAEARGSLIKFHTNGSKS